LWIAVYRANGSNSHYLLDLERKAIVGELANAGPVFMNRDQTKLLCYLWDKGKSPPWFYDFRKWAQAASHDRIRITDHETIGILNLKDNSVKPLGQISQYPGYGSSFVRSPDLHYAYNQSSVQEERQEVSLCDLEQETMTTVKMGGEVHGWWDEKHILVETDTRDLLLYDLETKTTTSLLTAEQLKQTAKKNGWLDNPNGFYGHLIYKWNGSEYAFYFLQGPYWLKIDKTERSLKLLAKTDVRYQPFGKFDHTETHYICAGDEASNTTSAIYVRNLADASERVLVPSNGSRGSWSPLLFRNTVIYRRSNLLYQISVDGGDAIRIFPPSK
jgi:hypothetical protein